MTLNPRSIRFRLIAWYAGLLLVLSALFGAYTYTAVRHYLWEVTRQNLVRRADSIAATLLRDIGTTGEAYVTGQLEARYAPAFNDRFIRLSRDDGWVIYLSGAPNDHGFDPHAISRPRLDAVPPVREEAAGNGRVLIVARVVATGGRQYLLETGYAEAEWTSVLHGLAWSLGLGLPLLAAAAAAGGWLLIGRALAPVGRLVGAAKNISLLHLDQRLPVAATGDQLEALALALNEMIARLDESFRHASRFSADASHELRTPLTILRGELEGMLRDQPLGEEMHGRLASILEETERLAKIVEGLFAISRLESGEATIEAGRLDLAQLAATTAEQMRLLADDRAIGLAVRAAAPVEIQGDRARLKQLVVNLLDNAIKYTPRGGAVSLAVTAEGGSAVLRVANTGPDIAEAALPRLFDRFFRAPESAGEAVEGSGLGLSIVRTICLAHGGSVGVANRPGQGPVFTVRLPLPARELRGGFFARA